MNPGVNSKYKISKKVKRGRAIWIGMLSLCFFLMLVLTIGSQKVYAYTLRISSDPSGAKVFLDGEYKGVTPVKISNLKDLVYHIRIEKDGYEPFEKRIWGGSDSSYTYELTPTTLEVSSNPSGARVFLDGEYKGVTPVKITNLKDLVYHIKIEKDGYESFETRIWGGSEAYRYHLKPLESNLRQASTSQTQISSYTLKILSTPSGAKVTLNGEYKGLTPIEITDLKYHGYLTRIEKDGYEPIRDIISLTSDTSRNYNLKPLISTPTPIPSLIEQLLKKADTYFNKQWFLTPKETNAFDVYKEVLKIEPDNYHAREKLHIMMRKYKDWGDRNYNQTNYEEAKSYYERFLIIAEYMITVLENQSRKVEASEVRRKLKELEVTLASKPDSLSVEIHQPPTPKTQPYALPVIIVTSDIPGETERETLEIQGEARDDNGITDVNVKVQHLEMKGLTVEAPLKREHEKFKAEVRLEVGKNRIIIEAINTIGQVGRQTFTVARTPPAAQDTIAIKPMKPVLPSEQTLLSQLKQLRGDVYAVIIGIGDYQDEKIPDLRYTEHDAREFHNLLLDPQYGRIPKDHVKLLLGKEATDRNIKTAIGRWLPRQAKAEDTVIIYYSGHGAPEEEDTYWVTYNADIDNLFATALNNNDIAYMLSRIESKRLITFLDSCYSAATVKRRDQTKNLQVPIPWEKFAGEGRVTISASDGKQLSLELEEYRHGVFTYYLLEGLKGKADSDQNGVLDVDEIWNYVKYQVTEITRKKGYPQTPVFQGSKTAGIPLTFNMPLLDKKFRQADLQKKKERIFELYQSGEISAEQFKKADDLLEAGEYNRLLEDFLAGKMSLERFKKYFK